MTTHYQRHPLYRLFIAVAMMAAAMLFADDYQWVQRTYSWSCSGVTRTQVVPIFGDEVIVRVTPVGTPVTRITVFDENDDVASRCAPKVICESTRFRGKRASIKNLEKLSILVESSGVCQVEIDQYLDSVEEWRLKKWLQKRGSLTPKKLAVWAGETSQGFTYLPKQPVTRLAFTQRGEGNVELIATAKDGTILFRRFMNTSGQQVFGWLHTTEEISFSIQAAKDTVWLLELTEE